MVKYILYVFFLGCFFSCATTGTSLDSDEVVIERAVAIDFPKTICFPLDYAVSNISNDEDIKMLVKNQPNLLRKRFNTSLEKRLKKNEIKIVKRNCNYELNIKELIFKEFKIQVTGPEVNVATIRVGYNFKSSTQDTILFDEVNRESIPEFRKTTFKEMCEDLSDKVMISLAPLLNE